MEFFLCQIPCFPGDWEPWEYPALNIIQECSPLSPQHILIFHADLLFDFSMLDLLLLFLVHGSENLPEKRHNNYILYYLNA